MSVFLKSSFPVPRSVSNIAKVAPSARMFVHDPGKERLWEAILIFKVEGESVGSFKDDFDVAERKNVSERTDETVLHCS